MYLLINTRDEILCSASWECVAYNYYFTMFKRTYGSATLYLTVCSSVLEFSANACVKHYSLFCKLDAGLCHVALSNFTDMCGFIKECMFLIVHQTHV